jgi:3-oxoacyl-[acyl-carrier protein] reductase
MGAATPVGRSGTSEEIAHAIAFLAGEGASYITGQLITVDGANSIAEERGR